jgi:hypothetical protein
MTDEELALLTPEERKGLEDDTLVDEGQQDEEDNDDELNPPEEKKEEEEEEQHQEQEQQKPGDEPEQPGRDDGEEEEPVKATPPLLNADLPADFDAQMEAIASRRTEIRTERRALTDKYEDGDMTAKEYHDQLDKLDDELSELNDKRADLRMQESKARIAHEANQSQAEQRWYSTVEVFMSEHPEITKNQTLTQAYDTIVQRVTAETMKSGKEPGIADLRKAYKQWAEDLGVASPEKKAEQPAQQKPQEQRQQRNVPPTLGKVPAAENNTTDDGKYAYLDRLAERDPVKYEEALAKLSPAQWEEYSQS